MGWEKRPGGVYYYRSVRDGSRVRKRYYGRGQTGELAAGFDDMARRRRRDAAKALEDERVRLHPLDELIAVLDAACKFAVEAELTAAGFHRQNYCAWRRRREQARP
jgi:hypothetical protein